MVGAPVDSSEGFAPDRFGWNGVVDKMQTACATQDSSVFCNTVLNFKGIGRTKKAYCRCGRIISLDSAHVNLKISLGKEIECPVCRNQRIAREIDELNAVFDGDAEVDF